MSNDHISIVGGDVPANQETYDAVREYIVAAKKQVNAAVNSAMVTAYWNIGKQIYEAVTSGGTMKNISIENEHCFVDYYAFLFPEEYATPWSG